MLGPFWALWPEWTATYGEFDLFEPNPKMEAVADALRGHPGATEGPQTTTISTGS